MLTRPLEPSNDRVIEQYLPLCFLDKPRTALFQVLRRSGRRGASEILAREGKDTAPELSAWRVNTTVMPTIMSSAGSP